MSIEGSITALVTPMNEKGELDYNSLEKLINFQIDSGISGLVESINLRRTILRDLDGQVHIIPNGEISVASNKTKYWSRVNLDIGVGYKENVEKVISFKDTPAFANANIGIIPKAT